MKTRRMKMGALAQDERGAALIAALMLTLVLSALGFVAVKSTTRSMSQTSNYKIRAQAGVASESALLFTTDRVGQKSSQYWDFMRARSEREQGVTNSARDTIERGAYMVVTRAQYTGTNNALQTPTEDSKETGLFSTSDASQGSMESGSSSEHAEFRVILRDPIEGPPMEGMQQNAGPGGSALCHKKIALISEYRYNTSTRSDLASTNNTWARASAAGMGRHYQETIIGPVLCN